MLGWCLLSTDATGRTCFPESSSGTVLAVQEPGVFEEEDDVQEAVLPAASELVDYSC